MADQAPFDELITLTADIVSAHVANNSIAPEDVPALIQSIYTALSALGAPSEPVSVEKPKGAVGIRASIKPEHLISMIDGKPYKMLRRHLTTQGHTPESYRETYGLPRDYPMVAANYAESRRTLAKAIGLGRRSVPAVTKRPASKPAPAVPKPRGRKPGLSVKHPG